jgi:hypothetical protein
MDMYRTKGNKIGLLNYELLKIIENVTLAYVITSFSFHLIIIVLFANFINIYSFVTVTEVLVKNQYTYNVESRSIKIEIKY